MPKWHACIVASIVAAIALATPSAWAQNEPMIAPTAGLEAPIGKVVSASGTVTIEHAVAVVLQANVPGGATQAKAGDFVYQGDVVLTGADSKLALAFTDGTAFNLSSNGRMVLDHYVYDPKSSNANSTLFSLAKGKFTFVAGKVATTGNMKFETPVGTMGIRGTTPHVEISDDGSVRFSTLVEGNKDGAAGPGGARQNKVVPRGQRQARKVTPSQMSPEQAASYNRLLNFEGRICRGC